MTTNDTSVISEETQVLANFLRYILSKRLVKVKFTKVNGELRTISGTTDTELIPSQDRPMGFGEPRNLNVINLYDVELSAWRSFRVDSLIKASYTIGDIKYTIKKEELNDTSY